MQCSTAKETWLFIKNPFPLFSLAFHSASFYFLSLFPPQKNTISFFPPCQNQTLPLTPHPLSLSLHPFLPLSGRGSDRHCSAVVFLRLRARVSQARPSLSSSIAARVFLKGSHPASTKPAHWEYRPTKEKRGLLAFFLQCSLSEAGLPPPTSYK